MEEQPKKSRAIIYTIMIGAFIAMFDGGVLTVGLPTLASEFNCSIDQIKWVTSSYLLSMSALLPVFGSYADKSGRKKMYNLGFLVISIFTLLCSFSKNLITLIILRILQGIGGAMFMANGMAIVVENYPLEEKGKNIGMIFAVNALGGLTGPPLGGIIIGLFSWKAVFYITFIVSLMGFFVSWKTIPEDEKENFDFFSFDFIGSISLILSIVGFVFGFSSIHQYGIKNLIVLTPIITFIISIIFFVIWETNIEKPLINLSMFKNWTFSMAVVASFLGHITMYSPEVLLPFYYQKVKGYSTQKSGLLLMAFPIAIFIASPIGGKLSDKIGPTIVASTGLGLNSICLFLISLTKVTTSSYFVLFMIVGIGLSQGLFMSPNSSSIMGSVKKGEYGTATGINQLSKNMGVVIGLTFSVEIFSSFLKPGDDLSYPIRFLDSTKKVFMICSVLSLIAMFISLIRDKKDTTEIETKI